jgi:hypothetical protein
MRLIHFVLVLTVFFGCKKDKVTPGNDPNFTIVENDDNQLKKCNKKVTVFEIPIYAVSGVGNDKLLHAANIMAQYLDNDEDGVVDNQAVHNSMLTAGAFLFMWEKERDLNRIDLPDGREGQDLGSEETVPSWHTNGQTGTFDAALEEVLHLITHAGYGSAYPAVFGEYAGTDLSNVMDVARGGNFSAIPISYPTEAWYTYDDNTCEYNCMVTEYFYWSLTSLLGVQKNRGGDISDEWDLNTKALLQEKDQAVFALLTDSIYFLPSVLPDGTYKR